MDKNITIHFSNKALLGICGIGGIGAILLWKKLQNEKRQEKNTEKDKFLPLLSPIRQQYLFAVTFIAWCSQLKPNIFPAASQSTSTILCKLYPLLPTRSLHINMLNHLGLINFFGTRKRGLITAGVSMILLTAYRKSRRCKSFINKVLTNRLSLRIYEYCGYFMPWMVMIQSAHSHTNSFNHFMAWFSLIFVSNTLSVTVGDPMFSFVKLRHIPYFSLFTYSLGLLSPNADISKPSYLSYAITSCAYALLLAAYKFKKVDNGNVKAYPLLCNMFMVMPYLYVQPEISLYIGTFFWIPTVYYFYYVVAKAEITRIVEGVYLGNAVAVNAHNIDKYSIEHIVELHDEYKNSNRFENVSYLSIEIGDRNFIEINKKFDETNALIAKCVANKENVLVHCSAGVSRSATIVTAYLICIGYSFEKAMRRMKRLRRSFDPNSGFVAQLKEFAEK
eukprot:1014653_1